MSSFIQYSNVLLDGFINNTKSGDVITKKHDLLQSTLDHYNLSTDNILFVGFSPWCLGLGNAKFSITEVSDTVIDFLGQQGCNYSHISADDLKSQTKNYNITVAADEYFTFASTDQDQRSLVEKLANVTKNVIITTLRDYKNQDFKEREFSQPIMIRGSEKNKIYLEHYEYDIKDKNSSLARLYIIENEGSSMHGPFVRRNMYFKQLAKFSIDAGANNFYVHKNLMYKSVIKKNYEHVITIKF